MFRGIYEPNPVVGVGQKCGPCREILEDAPTSLLSQIDLGGAVLSHKPDQFFGFVGVEVVQDDHEALSGVMLDKVADVVCEVLFAAGGADAGANDLAGGHFEATNEGLCPMSLILKLAQM